MPAPTFTDRLRSFQAEQNSVVCVGLDPDPARLPDFMSAYDTAEAVIRFNASIIGTTKQFACAYKLNFAFYESLGADGWRVLRCTIDQIPDSHLIIADAKRADIGNSARFYARAIFDDLGCDACTVSPYMGRDSLMPFFETPGTAAFALARTSNPGGDDFQMCACDGTPLYQHVGQKVADWSADAPGTGGLVAGATDVEALRHLRAACPSLPFLIPGVGAQGGDAEAVMNAAATDDGLVLVNSSRSIIYASSETNFAMAAGEAAKALRDTLNDARGA